MTLECTILRGEHCISVDSTCAVNLHTFTMSTLQVCNIDPAKDSLNQLLDTVVKCTMCGLTLPFASTFYFTAASNKGG